MKQIYDAKEESIAVFDGIENDGSSGGGGGGVGGQFTWSSFRNDR